MGAMSRMSLNLLFGIEKEMGWYSMKSVFQISMMFQMGI